MLITPGTSITPGRQGTSRHPGPGEQARSRATRGGASDGDTGETPPGQRNSMICPRGAIPDQSGRTDAATAADA
jgi:hypothetical protein